VGEALASTVEAKASPTNIFVGISCRLFDYGDDINGEPIEIQAHQINPYLVDAPTVLIEKRRRPLCVDAPEMNFGLPALGGTIALSLSKDGRLSRSWFDRLTTNGLTLNCNAINQARIAENDLA
jgi:hypothetical protein